MNQKPESMSASGVAAQRSVTHRIEPLPVPAVLTDLRRLWVKTTSPERRPSSIDAPPRCPLDHRDLAGWKWTPDPIRPGYRRAVCGFCGRFYGYASPEGKKRTPRR